MRPNSVEIISGIKSTFETHIVPVLKTKREQGMVRSILALLDHLSVRANDEGQMLADDICDMREVFRDLQGMFVDCTCAEMRSAVGAMIEQTVRRYRPAEAYPTIASLTEESENLKGALAGVIAALQDNKEQLAPDVYRTADRKIRSLLSRQLDRETVLITPFMGKRIY